MRLTVGPLPPAVYWRRRALVLGVLVLVGFVIFYSCTGPQPGRSGPVGNSSMATSTVNPTTTASATASATPTTTGSATPTATGTVTPTMTAPPQSETCTDDEIRLTATPSPADPIAGQSSTLTLLIKNISNRTCTRNIGNIPQELRLLQGDTVIWSSDDCSNATQYNYPQQFAPGYERSFPIVWHGYRTRAASGQQNCSEVPANRPAPGEYALVGRLGTLFSPPMTLTIRSAA